ncbi:MAG: DNA polymerase I, partial [Fusobacteriaceae bacterium]|nr:DNA polymerase I [Fusobacteriaceae bacterium]
MKKALLLDVSAMMYRAYFSLINMSNSKGEATGAIFGFTNMLLNLIEEYEPDYIIAAFDNKRSSLKRTEKFSEYKAQRKPMPEDLLEQVPKIEKLLDGFGIKKYRVEGHEADDVLGTLAKKYSALGIESFVATGDKDLSQIIDGNINIALLGKGEGKSKTKLIRTDADVVEQLGVTPDMIPDLFGLIGDTSDGIPGVRKVGEKKAIPMLEKYGNLEGIYENIDKLSEIPGIGKGLIQNIIEDKDMAFLSRELAVIELDVPLEFILEETKNTREDSILFELFMDCDMKSLIKKLDLKEKQVMEVSTEISDKVEDTKEKIEKVFCIPKTDKELNEILDRVFNSEKVFLYSGKFGLSLSNLKESVYIPTKHFYLGANNFSLELVKPYFQKGNKVITYNAKTILNKEFYIENLYFDIAIANYLLTANTRDDLSMIIET